MVTERTVLVRLRANADPFIREMHKARSSVRGLRDDIDTSNKRSAWLVQGLAAIGPAAVTAGAAAIPVLVGLATQATIGAAAVGTMVLAFQGVGDALKAVNEYQLDPTTKNLAKMHDALAVLGPDGAHFVKVLDEVGEKLNVLKLDSRAEMFPGMEAGLDALLTRLPDLRRVVSEISSGIGQLASDAGTSIAGPGFDDFFTWLESEAQPILVETGKTIGNFFKGFAELMISFTPLTRDFSKGFLEMSRGFASWAAGLDETQGFQSFIGYVNENGPKVLDLLGSLGNALVEIAKAAAPVGEIMVPILTGIANALSLVADTPAGSFLILGAAITALYGRMMALAGGGFFRLMTGSLVSSTKAAKTAIPTMRQFGNAMLYAAHSQKALAIGLNSQSMVAQAASKRAIEARAAVTAFGKAVVPVAASVGVLAFAMSPLPQKLGLTNTAMGAMVGLIAGPWGAAVGAGVGFMLDLTKSVTDMGTAVAAADQAMQSMDPTQLQTSLRGLKDSLDDEINLFEKIFGQSDRRLDKTNFQIRYIEESLKALDNQARSNVVRKRMEADAEATVKAGDAFRDLSKDFEKPEKSLRQLMKTMREWGEASREQSRNIREALKNGVDPRALNQIIEDLGPAAGLALKQLADGGKAAARDVNESWRFMNRGAKTFEGSLDDVKDAIRELPFKPEIDVDDKKFRRKVREALDQLNILDQAKVNPYASMNTKAALKAARDLDKKMRETEKNGPKPKAELTGEEIFNQQLALLTRPRTVSVTVAVRRGASAAVDSVANSIAKATGRAHGGFTGPGGKYEPAGIVHRGEVVIPQERVRRDKPFLMSRYGDLPGMNQLRGMATGGLAGADTPRVIATGAPVVGARETREAAQALKGLAREAKQSSKHMKSMRVELAKLRNRRESLLGQRSDLMGSVSSGLRSDLWDGGEWGEGSDPLSILRGDIRNAKAFRAGAIQLRRKGLTGAALAEILRDGDLGRVQQMASMSRRQLAEYRELYGAREAAIRGGARAGGNLTYGPALDQINRRIAGLQRAVERNGKRNSDEHDKDRRQQRGAQDRAGRRRNRGVV